MFPWKLTEKVEVEELKWLQLNGNKIKKKIIKLTKAQQNC